MVLGAAAFAALWAFVIEPNRLVVRNVTLKLPRAPKLRIAVLGDLHAGAHFIGVDKLRAIVARTNETQPDLVLLLGDYLNNGASPTEETRPLKGGFLLPEIVAPELGKLRAKYGVFAVLGNHDWWLDGERITAVLRAQSITVLENDATSIALPAGETLWLAGVADAMTRSPEIPRALAKVPEGALVIVMTHSPESFRTCRRASR